MSIDDEIQKEYEKVKTDKIVNETIANNNKKEFADMLLNGNIGLELKNCNKYYINTKPIKKPFKMRLNNFINRIKTVLWS